MKQYAELFTFPKAARLLARREFLLLQQRGKRRHSPHFVVVIAPTQTQRSRLGITTSRRFGKAVARNRVKRMVREFFRLYQTHITPAHDIVIIPKPGAHKLALTQVAEELTKVLPIVGKST